MIPVPAFAQRTVALFGLGRSGLATARALRAGGARVLADDDRPGAREEAGRAGFDLADLVGTGHGAGAADWSQIQALVLSPGVPLTHPAPHPVVARAEAAGVEVIGDIELFLRARPVAGAIAITGTNGKSTTTALTAHLLASAGREVAAGGNLGTPVLDLPPLGAQGTYVLELSSYQIDLTPSLATEQEGGFEAAVLLNITPDHLDRHGSLKNYAAIKERLLQGAGVRVVGIDDELSAAIAGRLAAQGGGLVRVTVGRRREGAVSVEAGRLYDEKGREIADLTRCPALPGAHNWQNAAAAFALARARGLDDEAIRRGLLSFPGLAHRLERVAEIAGIGFVNDSKATNAEAAAKALACFERVYWIAGGRAKAGGIRALKPYFPRLRHAFLIGEAAEDFAATLGTAVPFTWARTLERAVPAAFDLARREGLPGAVVLLSPACASFDQFSDFEARGKAFAALVAGLDRPVSRAGGSK